jgi:Fic family protein
MNSKSDINPDIKECFKVKNKDRGETVGLMEPLVVSESTKNRTTLTDLAIELASKSAGFRRSLPEGVLYALAKLVRAMNCYYSNLIEGHVTHPVEIEHAMKEDYSSEPEKRNLQLEAKAHISVQQWIDEGGLKARAASRAGICEIHYRFCKDLPEELLWIKNPETNERVKVKPGELRDREVKVGSHVPVSPGAVPRFLERFENAYSSLGKVNTILAVPAAHHRLLWIHPFMDGNGRVARLMSYAILLETLDTGGLWSVARGLARNVSEYKSMLMACDAERRNDLDGRGHLSEEALFAFSEFFLQTCIDQVDFMEGLVQPGRLRNRIMIWAEEEIRAGALFPRSEKILEAILYRGDLPRNEVAELLGVGERQARRVTSVLLEREILSSPSTRAPLYLAFPASLASRWMPGLFPEN